MQYVVVLVSGIYLYGVFLCLQDYSQYRLKNAVTEFDKRVLISESSIQYVSSHWLAFLNLKIVLNVGFLEAVRFLEDKIIQLTCNDCCVSV